jgi:hypothetical protein
MQVPLFNLLIGIPGIVVFFLRLVQRLLSEVFIFTITFVFDIILIELYGVADVRTKSTLIELLIMLTPLNHIQLLLGLLPFFDASLVYGQFVL